jgi:hypothetical protein
MEYFVETQGEMLNMTFGVPIGNNDAQAFFAFRNRGEVDGLQINPELE